MLFRQAWAFRYVVRNFGAGSTATAARLRPLLDDPEPQRALAVLRPDFAELDAGPMCVAAFVTGGRDDALRPTSSPSSRN
jgi:hypothetical protein